MRNRVVKMLLEQGGHQPWAMEMVSRREHLVLQLTYPTGIPDITEKPDVSQRGSTQPFHRPYIMKS